MLSDWSTVELPRHTRFCNLQEMLNQSYMPAVPYAVRRPTINGSYRMRNLGRCTIFEITADGHGIKRSRREINNSEGEFYSVKYLRRGCGEFEQEGKRIKFRSGDISVLDNCYPYSLEFEDSFAVSSFIIPRALLNLHLASARTAVGGLIPAASSFSPMLRSHMNALIELENDDIEFYSSTLNDTLCSLIAIALDHANRKLEANQQGANHLRYQAVIEYVRLNLSDPDLSPAKVAATCGISVRYLHKLFEPYGYTFGRWLLKQRLERCREQIADPRFADKKLSLIPYDWGFNNLSHFIRTFRREYGLSPREYRKQACLQPTGRDNPGQRMANNPRNL